MVLRIVGKRLSSVAVHKRRTYLVFRIFPNANAVITPIRILIVGSVKLRQNRNTRRKFFNKYFRFSVMNGIVYLCQVSHSEVCPLLELFGWHRVELLAYWYMRTYPACTLYNICTDCVVLI